MTRIDFISMLFNCGHGLTLDQIERAEAYAHDDAAMQTFDDAEMPSLIEMAREVYIQNMRDCEDMIELRKYLNNTLYTSNQPFPVTDQQVYALWNLIQASFQN